MRKILLVLIVFLVGYTAQAIPSNLSYLNQQSNLRLSDKADVAYHIVLEDGGQTRIYDVPRLDETLYLPNTIIIKTKDAQTLNDNRLGFYNAGLQGSLAGLNPTKIESLTEGVSFQSNEKKNKTLAAHEAGLQKIYTVYYQSGIDPYDACISLMQNPDIEYAEPVFRRSFHHEPNDPEFSKQWGVTKINAIQAWDKSRGSEEVVVAVVDSGTDIDHEDLAANIWTNPHEIPDDGIDNDNNGKVDDVNGWDMVGDISVNQYYQGIFDENNNPRNSVNTHGTNVAGCVSGVADNSVGIAGIGFSCKIWPIKCASQNISGGGIMRGYHGILYASGFEEIKIINCSWGGPGFQVTEEQIINTAFERGCLVVTSSGNDGMNIDNGGAYPACYKNAFSVGMTRSNDKAYVMSNWGYVCDVYAPGVSVYTTEAGNKYKKATGTSFSSPITAGVAALLLSYRPTYSAKQLWHQIRSSSDNVVNPADRGRYFGRVNAYNALNENKLPGIEAVETKLALGTALTDYSKNEIEITVTNYLFNANNVSVELKSMGGFLDLSEDQVFLGKIETDGVVKFKVDLQLLSNNPWYIGNANIILTFKSPSYINYQLISIPIDIPTSNSQRNAVNLNDYQTPQWTQAHSPNSNTLWACGRYGVLGSGGAVFKFANGNTSVQPVGQYPIYGIYGIYGFDDTKAVAVGTSGDQSAVFVTNNGGANWTNQNMSVSSPFLNNIHFFNETKGVIIGDPIGTKWGILTTSNGGDSWKLVNSPNSGTGEANMPRSFATYDEYVWFGTTMGRIFKSNSNGNSWTVGTIEDAAEVYYLAFNSKSTGMAIYKDANTGEIKLAYTSNGSSWKNDAYNFTENTIEPIGLFAPEDSPEIYYHTVHGELIGTSNNGKAWKAILSKYISSAKISTMVQHEGEFRSRLWNLDQEIGYFDFSYRPANADDRLDVVSDDPVEFGDVKMGSSRNKKMEIKNIGNVPVNMQSYEIVINGAAADETFDFFGGRPDFIEPNQSESFFVRYKATALGEQTAELRIGTNGSPSIISIDLNGNGIDSQVKEIEFADDGPIKYDSVWVDSTKFIDIEVENIGNVDVSISNVAIDGENPTLFVLAGEAPTGIEAGKDEVVRVGFTPNGLGPKSAILTITSDGDPNEITINLEGIGVEPTSVEDNQSPDFRIASISPNPVSQTARVEYFAPNNAIAELTIKNLEGKDVMNVSSNRSQGTSSNADFSVDFLSPGAYYLVLRSGSRVTMMKFIVSK
jgi:subtilisin family serine protease